MGFTDLFRRPLNPDALPAAIRADQARTLVSEGAILVDVRESAEWKSGHPRGAIHIPLGRLATSTGRLKGRPVVLVCASGSRSRAGARQLRSHGINATSLKGGVHAWHAAGGTLA